MSESRDRYRSTRVTDADRDHAAERLRLAAGHGRLDIQELERRLDAVYVARTYGEIEPLVKDLPLDQVGEAVSYAETMEIRQTGVRIVRRGRWKVPRRVVVTGKFGATRLDFSHALIVHPDVEIALDTSWTSIRIIVPKGASVDTEQLTMSVGSLSNSAASVPQKNAPRFRITGSHTGGRVRVGYPLRFGG
ncbi:DUF1707 SHOCT-like domain-containing protein [Solicola gregarius]|uniref:DUF1707 domain-containing protein n=1 Tax=Solicola gregarius TaxID=2908642 RepID=A0AA46YLF8_9ACTN|nr:DUF1707 domain-containing protein [Solicola gregarius]UYM05549.1 DUF1707 domain-containing protein [Solicola gregarius]